MNDTIFENRWRLIGKTRDSNRTRYHYVFENIYNKETMEISDTTYGKLIEGKTTINQIRSHKLGHRRSSRWNRKISLRLK